MLVLVVVHRMLELEHHHRLVELEHLHKQELEVVHHKLVVYRKLALDHNLQKAEHTVHLRVMKIKLLELKVQD
jgi:hypothetical protein